MSTGGSVTGWVGRLKAGDRAAAQRLWEGYFRRLVGLARVRLADAARRVADEEDVALSAFDSFCRGAELGRFPQLHDRNDLWALLVVTTARKAVDLVQHERRRKRGGGAVVPASALPGPHDSGDAPVLERVMSREPTPEFALQVAEECRRLLELLPDPALRSVALWKMEGDTHQQIAERLGCVPRTVERKLQIIRGYWGREAPP